MMKGLNTKGGKYHKAAGLGLLVKSAGFVINYLVDLLIVNLIMLSITLY